LIYYCVVSGRRIESLFRLKPTAIVNGFDLTHDKNKSTVLIAQNNAFVIPLLSAPKCFLKRLAVLACTRSNCRILYSEVILRGTLSGQHLGYRFR